MDVRHRTTTAILMLFTLIVFIPGTLKASEGARENGVSIDRIVVSLSDFKLLAYDNQRIVKVYPIAIGGDTGPTPTGHFEIVNKLKNPWYTPDDEPAKAPGPNNPLGTRWLGIDKPSYGIHGTRNPNSIGTKASEGCVRLFNHHVEELYRQVQTGTKVIIKQSIDDIQETITARVLHPDKTSS